MKRETRRSITALGLLLVVSMGACGSETQPLAGATKGAAELPDLTNARSNGKPLLTIIGPPGTPKVKLDMAALDSLPEIAYTIDEPFIQQEVRFRGVRLWDLLQATGLDDQKEFHFLALDNYQVDLTAEQIRRTDPLLATLHNGEEIAIADGGPVRIVFPLPSPEQKNTDLWIWSLTRIDAS